MAKTSVVSLFFLKQFSFSCNYVLDLFFRSKVNSIIRFVKLIEWCFFFRIPFIIIFASRNPSSVIHHHRLSVFVYYF